MPGADADVGLNAAAACPRRDVLVEYGKLMKYNPTPTKNAYCYDGPLALRQFGPDPNDAADVLETYPWCASHGVQVCVGVTMRLNVTALDWTRMML